MAIQKFIPSTLDPARPDVSLWEYTISKDERFNLDVLDLTGYSMCEIQFVGNITAGGVTFRGGLTPDMMTSAAGPRWVHGTAGTYTTSLPFPVVGASPIYGAAREFAETNLPPFIQAAASGDFAGEGKLYIRASR
ncbi:hypothetical protein ALI44B_04595 [Leifsonia sp. ALI-44-B]|uniref:hypothetical protein n=1 Tax=Leifsonia sp. ALI-44-B TaxID=1933776 RepID=UPI00097C914F|nr:hypothetical protein [Leifsonia sp. ALI-44-B]ONI63909.1 hypothetical protein ALI44B_04595 [Leifsonia sp. ALI-44-B]